MLRSLTLPDDPGVGALAVDWLGASWLQSTGAALDPHNRSRDVVRVGFFGTFTFFTLFHFEAFFMSFGYLELFWTFLAFFARVLLTEKVPCLIEI